MCSFPMFFLFFVFTRITSCSFFSRKSGLLVWGFFGHGDPEVFFSFRFFYPFFKDCKINVLLIQQSYFEVSGSVCWHCMLHSMP